MIGQGARARSVPVKASKTHSYKICKHVQKLFMSDAPQNAQKSVYTVRGAQKQSFPPAPGSSKKKHHFHFEKVHISSAYEDIRLDWLIEVRIFF